MVTLNLMHRERDSIQEELQYNRELGLEFDCNFQALFDRGARHYIDFNALRNYTQFPVMLFSVKHKNSDLYVIFLKCVPGNGGVSAGSGLTPVTVRMPGTTTLPGDFTDDLNDRTSAAFKEKEAEACDQVGRLHGWFRHTGLNKIH